MVVGRAFFYGVIVLFLVGSIRFLRVGVLMVIGGLPSLGGRGVVFGR